MRQHRTKKSSHWTRLGRSMLPIPLTTEEKRRLRNRIIAAALLLLGVWFTFFDRHILIKRISWHREHDNLVEANAKIRAGFERLEGEVAKGLSDEVVERIARGEYGMRRPGATVYRIAKAD